MAINRTGLWSENPATGLFVYGDGGTGAITVDGSTGSVELDVMASNSAYNASFLVGRTNGGSYGTGSATITNTGTVNVTSNGHATFGAVAIIGNSSNGTLNISASGSLIIADTLGPSGSGPSGGGEFFGVGLNGGTGTLNVNNGSVSVSGTGAQAGFGLDGGSATVNFLSGSSLWVQSTTTSNLDYAGLVVGRNGGTANVLFDRSNAEIKGNGFIDSYVNIGQNASGTVTLQNLSSLQVTTAATSPAAGPFWVSAHVGRAGGSGELIVDHSTVYVTGNETTGAHVNVGREGGDGTLTVRNDGTVNLYGNEAFMRVGRDPGSEGELLLDGSILNLNGISMQARLDIGTEGGVGSASLQNNSWLSLAGGNENGIQVGRGAVNAPAGYFRSEGTLVVEDSHIRIYGSSIGAYMNIGHQGGHGEVSILDGSSVLVESSAATGYSVVNVGGHQGDGQGELTVDASSLSISGTNGHALLTMGRQGTGQMSIQNGGEVALSGVTAGVFVGQYGFYGGSGTLSMTAGSTLSIGSHGGEYDATGMVIGADGGTGQVTVNDSLITIWAQSANAGIVVGSGPDDFSAGTGTLIVENGGRVELQGYDYGPESAGASLVVGGWSGSNGHVVVRTGGVIDLDFGGDLDGHLKVGGYEAGAIGLLEIIGAGSSVHGYTYASVGRNPYDDWETGNSTGRLHLANGGSVGNSGATTIVGNGGTITGNNGNVVGDLVLAGGAINLTDGLFGTLSISGELVMAPGFSSRIELDLGAAGNDKIAIGGTVDIFGDLQITLTPVGGYTFTQGEARQLVSFGGIGEEDGEVYLDVDGQHANFSFYAGEFANAPNTFSILALNSGSTGGLSILDFGSSATWKGEFFYDSWAREGEVWGGQFANGGTSNHVDVVYGTAVGDTLLVDAGGDSSVGISLYGRGGDDTLQGGAGNDLLDGGAGIDIAIYSGLYSNYSITFKPASGLQAAGYTITDLRAGSPDGTDILIDIETLRFTDLDHTLPPVATNRPPVVSVADQTVLLSEWKTVSSWISVSDPDGDAIVRYELWDGGTGSNSAAFWKSGSGYFTAGAAFSVEAADLGNIWLQGGSAAGTETMWARAFDGTNWSAWDAFTVKSAPPNRAPVITVADQTVRLGEWKTVSSLINVTDADGDAMVRYELWDSGTGSNSAAFWKSGSGYFTAGAAFSVEAADLGNIWLQGGSAAGTETMWARAFDGTNWSAWDAFTVKSAPPNRAPVVTVADQTVRLGEWKTVSSLINVTDADGDAMVRYELWDSGTGSNSAAFWKSGSGYFTAGAAFSVEAADLGNIWLQGGSAAGTETMWARAFDGTNWSAWDAFTVKSAPPNRAPVVTVADQTVLLSEWKTVSSWINVTDADGDAMVRYELWDSGTGSNSAAFWKSGSGYFTAGAAFSVEAADLGNIWLQGGSAAGTETMWARAFDGTNWSAWDAFTVKSALPNRAPVVSVADQKLALNEWKTISSWINVSDADGDAMVRYEFWDSGTAAASGYLWKSSTGPVPAAQTLVVEAADLNGIWVRGGSAAGTETMWVRAFDGTDWSTWDTFTLTSAQPNRAPVVSVVDQKLALNEWKTISSWINVSDADGDAMVRYEFWDSGTAATSGYLWKSSTGAVPAAQTLVVEAADLNGIWVRGGSAAGSETMWVRAFDGTDWSTWDTFTLTSEMLISA